MVSGQAEVVILAVQSNVEFMLGTELLHHVLNVLHFALTTSHGLGREVGVAAGSVPLGEKFGGDRNVDAVVLRDAVKNVAGHVKVIANLNSEARSNLIFPLTGSNLSVGSRDVDAGVEAGSVVLVSNDSSEALAGTGGAVVRALLTWVPVLGPAKRHGGEFTEAGKHLVFLLDAVPGLLIGALIPDFGGKMAEVGKGGHQFGVGGVLPGEGLAHDKDVVSLPEWIGEESTGFQSNLRVFCWGLPA